MRVVSEQSAADIKRRKAREALTWPLRELTANLLRIANGAGRPLNLAKQLAACSTAIQAYAETHNALPSEQEIHGILDCDRSWEQYRRIQKHRAEMKDILGEDYDEGTSERDRAERLIRKGAHGNNRVRAILKTQGRPGHLERDAHHPLGLRLKLQAIQIWRKGHGGTLTNRGNYSSNSVPNQYQKSNPATRRTKAACSAMPPAG